MPSNKTISKCNRILEFYEYLYPRKHCAKPINYPYVARGKLVSRSHNSSASKYSLGRRKDFSFSKNNSYTNSCSKPKKNPKDVFVTVYNRESRYDKIMKLKVKPVIGLGNTATKQSLARKKIMDTSFGSMASSRSSANKENIAHNRYSRFEKIMKLKVTKPKVNSTLAHYEPRVGSKSLRKESKESSIKYWKYCVQSIKRSVQQSEKEDRLWRIFERERYVREKLRRYVYYKYCKYKRRKEKLFETIVEKEVRKIQKEGK